MNYKHKLFLILILTGKITISNTGRGDIEWITNYEDFATNKGKYSIGRKGVIVYKKDGTESGKIKQPIPNFDGVIDAGNFALWGDPQLLTGVKHVDHPTNFTFSKRHIRDDVELYSGYKDSTKEEKYKKFSEGVEGYYRLNIGLDYSLIRTNKVIFDAYIPEGVAKEDWDRIQEEDLLARVGGGLNYIAIDKGKEEKITKYGNLAGGLNKVKKKYEDGIGQIDRNIELVIEKEAKTPLDSGTKPGDSGSPLFWWDKENNKWLIASSNSSGIGTGYGKESRLLSNPEMYEKWKEGLTDKEIKEDNVIFENGLLKVNNVDRKFDDKNRRDQFFNKIYQHVNSLNDKIDEKMIFAKNQIFNKENLEVDVKGETDTGSARLEFKKNTTLKGSGKLTTAGFVVHKNATLTYKLNFGQNNIVRKIGEGKLIIKSDGRNYGELNLGGGETVLENEEGVAASVIRLAQGAKLTINRADQISDNNVVFGHRGGTLNLNGTNLEFKDIYHMDKDVKIVNENEETNKKSIFTFKPSGEERVFLGSFKGNLDLVYSSSSNNSKWSIRSEETEIKGKFDIENGNVKIEGDNVLHGYDNLVYKDEYKEANFKSESINVKNSSILSVNRGAKVESKINIDKNASLEINALGIVKDILKPYDNVKSEKEINETVIKGAIEFKNSMEDKDYFKTNFKANVENNNVAKIEAEIKGNVKAIKEGSGLLHLTKERNSELKGSFEVKGGKLKINKESTLGSSKISIENNSVFEVENNNNEIRNLLDKIEKSSKGVLSLGKDISSIDKKYKDYSNLYLGSNKSITIGSENEAIDSEIKTLNLGGDNGTVTLKGLDKSSSLSKLNVGDGENRGTVVIDKIGKSNTSLSIDVKKGINLKINNNDNSNKIVKLIYGSSIDSKYKNILKEDSEGVAYIESWSDSINDNKIAVGVAKGKEVDLNEDKSNSKNYFSGEGKLNINYELKDKELTVDGQYFSGGVIELKKKSENYKNNVTVMGNKEGKNEGDITLRLGDSKAIGSDSKILVKDGGKLDLNGNDLEARIDENNNKYGSIINKNAKSSTLTINADEKDLSFNNRLVGNINIVKKGNKAIEFTNEENYFNETGIKEILVKEGQLNYFNSKPLKNTKINIENGSTLKIKTEQVISEVIANGGKIKVESFTDSLKEEKSTNFSKLTLQKDLVVEGPANKGKVTYTYINLAGNKITLKNQSISRSNFSDNEKRLKGEVIFDNSVYYLSRINDTILYNRNISKLTLDNSNMTLKGYNIINGNSDKLVKIEVQGKSTIANVRENINNSYSITYLYNPITIKENSSLTLSSNDNNSSYFSISSKIKGQGKIILEQISNGSIRITDNFKDFNGSIEAADNSKDKEFKFYITSSREEDRILGYKFINGNYSNVTVLSLGFKNIKEFTGKIHSSGDVLLIGKDALTTNGKIVVDNKNVIFRTEEDSVMDKMDIEAENNNNRITKKEYTSKIIKEGIGNLTINNITTKNINNIDINGGSLTINNDILNKEESKYSLNGNTKLIADFKNEEEFKAKITGSGDFLQKGSKKVTINSKLLENTGNLELNGELDLKLDNDTVLKQKLIGNESGKLNVVSSDNETKELEINKELSKFNGTINIEKGNLSLNIQDGVINNKITGDKTLSNKNERQLILNNIDEFKGTVESSKGDVLLKFNNSSAISKYSINGGNIKINSNIDIDLTSKSFENKGDKSLVKLGETKLTLDSKNLKDIKNISVDAGTLLLKKNNESNQESIEASLNINKNANLNLLDDINIKSITNSGDIILKEKVLKIGEYKSNGGKFEIHLKEKDKNLLEIENSDKDINALVKIEKDIVDKIIYNSDKFNVAKISDRNLNILNLEEYDSVYELDVEKDKNNVYKLYSMIKADALNKLYMFNELDLINSVNSELKYRNIIEANYVSYNKIDKDYLDMKHNSLLDKDMYKEEKSTENIAKTEYKNKLHGNGVEINFERANDVSKLKISGGFNFKVLGNVLTTDVKTKEAITQKFVSIGIIPKFGIKYKYFDINLGLGLNTIVVNNKFKNDNLIYLNNTLNIGLNPKFKVNKDISIKYLNKVGYKINTLLTDSISKDKLVKYDISHKKPISIYYETGVRLEHRYVDFYTKSNVEYNFSNYEISNNGKSIENSFKDDWRVNMNMGFEFKPTERVYINLDFDANIYQKSYGKYVFKLGTGYNW